uniref:Putative secreted protein n=1 Tax=Ixodes ricinus TaxID=34613 RepID=A0A6B0USM5_IXORI
MQLVAVLCAGLTASFLGCADDGMRASASPVTPLPEIGYVWPTSGLFTASWIPLFPHHLHNRQSASTSASYQPQDKGSWRPLHPSVGLGIYQLFSRITHFASSCRTWRFFALDSPRHFRGVPTMACVHRRGL